jgi:hypothetical protein
MPAAMWDPILLQERGSDHAGGPCQRFARNCATRNLTPPHHPTLDSASDLRGCVGT